MAWVFAGAALWSLYWLISVWREQTHLRQRAQELEGVDPEAPSEWPLGELPRRELSTGAEPRPSLQR